MSGLKKSNIPTTIFPQDKTSKHVENTNSDVNVQSSSDNDLNKKVIVVRFEDNDPEDPENWSYLRKWITVSYIHII